ncbi:MAG: hypothetical protein Fur006_14640 [Coleofasciculaceae cyanobacterium]
MTQSAFGRSQELRYQQLYNLLPAIYRVRDAEQGLPLQALLAILERELQTVDADIDGLYDNWFIETCDRWVVPYIGALLNAQGLYARGSRTYGQQERRAYVANTLAYRRRKGTVPVLEQLVQDVTGWRARAVEFFQLLATTQTLNYERPNNTTVDLRQDKQPYQLGTPFERQASYTVEVRSVNSQRDRGRYNIPNIGLFIWRLHSYPIQSGTARLVTQPQLRPRGRHYTFNPLGLDSPLFNLPRTDTDIIRIAEEIHLPTQLRPEALIEELKARFEQKNLPDDTYFGDNPVFEIFADGESIPATQILITNLGPKETPATTEESQTSQTSNDARDWQPPANQSLTLNDGTPYRVAVDPELGRIVFLRETPTSVTVNYAYGFSDDLGGGTYDRSESLARATPQGVSRITWIVDPDTSDTTNNIVPSCTEAAARWNALVQIWQLCQEKRFISLARLTVDDDGNLSILKNQSHRDDSLAPRCQPGILQGLSVTAKPGRTQVTVTAGTAIDARGRRLQLPINYPVSLRRWNLIQAESQIVWLVLTLTAGTQQCHVQVVSDAAADPLNREHIRLARLIVNSWGQILSAETNLCPEFQPGILEGLQVYNSSRTQIRVTPGVAVNSQGKRIVLEDAQILDLTSHRSPILTLFIAPQASSRWQQVDVVPDVDVGVITVKSNRTYREHLHLDIPADKQLHLIAANGDRPHLLGNLSIRGIASKDDNPGELTVDGLLIEGSLTVRPGNLKQLRLSHCTIVPRSGTVVVEPANTDALDTDEGLTLIALVMYWLNLIRRLLELGTDTTRLSASQILYQLIRLGVQQGTYILLWGRKAIQSGQCLPECQDDGETNDSIELFSGGTSDSTEQDNPNLTLTIERSITGSLSIADTVPHLEIVDSFIDNGSNQRLKDNSEEIVEDAIAAPNTTADIQTTTVLGYTRVRSLEASNSIFTDKVVALRQQVGCVRFSYVPFGSYTPRRYLCQPDRVLAEALDRLPATVTAFAIASNSGETFAATARNGIFQTPDMFQATASEPTWTAMNQGLTDSNVTALAMSLPASETEQFRLFAGTASGRIFHSEDRGQTWQQLGMEATTGSLAIGRRASGTLASTGILVQGEKTHFTTELQVGDAITAGNQTRQITRIKSDTELLVDAPFQPQLVAKTSFTINTGYSNTAITALLVDRSLRTASDSDPEESPSLFAGTAGSGILRYSDRTQTWEVASNGITHLYITALAVNPRGQLVAGTAGGGIFYSNDNGRNWQSINTGLTSRHVTALATDASGQLFAGTDGGGVFYFEPDGQLWCAINTGLTHRHVTALAVYARPVTGTISSQGTTVTGDEQTAFLTQLQIDDGIAVGNQTRRITQIISDRELTIDLAFCPDLPSDTPFTSTLLFAGTSGGGTFRSTSKGDSWTCVNTSSTSKEVTALSLWVLPDAQRLEDRGQNREQVLVGTAIGTIFHSRDRGDRWVPTHRGLINVDAAITILSRLQPSFTSTDYGHPGYGQLSLACPEEIRTGAEDGSEMGAFSYLKQPQRQANLQMSLEEYLRFGLDAGLIYVN